MNFHQLMVDLDAIVDTRLAVVSILDPQFSCALLGPEYHSRTTDWFIKSSSIFTEQQYRDRYAKRDVQVLEHAMMTQIIDVIGELILEKIKAETDPLAEQTYRIFLNTAPYVLSEDAKETLVKTLLAFLPMVTEIVAVSIPQQWLTRDYFLSNRISTYITYDVHDWLALHCIGLEKAPLQGLFVIGPEIMREEPDLSTLSEDERKEYDNVGPFRAFEFSAMPYLSLRLIGAEMFSCILKA